MIVVECLTKLFNQVGTSRHYQMTGQKVQLYPFTKEKETLLFAQTTDQ
jgi:hypothetical protein